MCEAQRLQLKFLILIAEQYYHGTGTKYADSIDAQGLLPKSRLYVHLSPVRDGNLSHYAAVGFHQKTRDHNRYGAVLMPCKRDKAKREEHRQQVAEYITDWRDCR